MNEIEEIYENFGSMLEKGDGLCALSSFEDACSFLGTDRQIFEGHILSEVGLTGDEVLEIYRKTSRMAGSGE